MKNFLSKSTIFIIPIIALFILPLIIFLRSGEELPISTVVNIQQNSSSNILYLSSLTAAYDKYYKLLTTIKKNPEIIVFGTSRTLTFQSDFFDNPDTFYNAGYSANTSMSTADLLTFINAIPTDSKLRLILFDVSSFLNSPNTESPYETNDFFESTDLFLSTGWHDIYTDYFEGNISLDKLKGSESNIGLTALMHDFGYQKDGSLNRGSDVSREEMQKNVPSEISDDVALIENGNISEFGNSIPQENLAIIEQFLKICKSRNIYVIGYFSPYAQEIYNTMFSLQNAYGNAYRNSPAVLSSIFAKYNYHFYDLRNISIIGSSDSELYDDYHPTEKATIRLLIYLANREPLLQLYVNISKLKEQINSEPF